MLREQLQNARTALTHRRTKIVATVGPASSAPAMLERLIGAGVDMFRLNFSHGSHESHGQVYADIRAASARLGRQVAILADLCGPKIRAGRFQGGGIELEKGALVTVTTRAVQGGPGLIPSEYAELAEDVKAGDRILLDDGKLQLRVIEVTGPDVACEVVQGGRLSDRKGINLPGVEVSTPSLTAKDRDDARFAAELGVDYMALSFVRRATDVGELKALLRQLNVSVPVISKIEKPEAITNIEEILEISDGVMVARGDLGVEMAAEEVPLIQRELTRMAIERNRVVIVATQMLESMIQNPRPTRAEVTDVAWACMAGADAVMLSGETAAGDFPVEAVSTMNRVLRMVEGSQFSQHRFGQLVRHEAPATVESTVDLQLSEALARATAHLSREINARTIVVRSVTGHTAQMIAAERPASSILAVTVEERTARRLALCWGVIPHVLGEEALERIAATSSALSHELGVAQRGDFVLLVSGGPSEAEDTPPGIHILIV